MRRRASSRSAVRFAGEKKCSSARSACLGDVDLSFLQPLDQVVRRDVDQLDSIRAIEDGVRHRLADADARDLRDDVVQALEVLDVDGGVDVDAVLQQFLDIEIALGVPAARRVGVRKLVDKGDLRAPGNDGVEVHLLQLPAFVFNPLPRHGLQARKQRLRLLPAMRLDDADDDIVAVALARARGLKHRIGLADAGRGADEDPELARRGPPPAGQPPARPPARAACRRCAALQASRFHAATPARPRVAHRLDACSLIPSRPAGRARG